MASTSADCSREIDSLLERYLYLLNQYNNLRLVLSNSQSTIHQSIARANFSADRGARYGQDHYDARMQANRICHVTTVAPESGTCHFDVQATSSKGQGTTERPPVREKKAACKGVNPSHERERLNDDSARVTGNVSEKFGGTLESEQNATEDLSQGADRCGHASSELDSRNPLKHSTPIKMFGLFTPPALRTAQTEAITMIEHVVPLMINVDAQMKATEIQIRQARKRRSKAGAEESKETISVCDRGQRKTSQWSTSR